MPGLPEAVTREAYWHEVSTAGFWPGNQAFLGPLSMYAYPEPAGFRDRAATPGTHLDATPGEFILPYDWVRTAADFDALLLDFLSTICAAAAANAKRSFEIVAEVPGEMIEGIAP